MLAAVKPIKAVNLTPVQNEDGGTSRRDSSFRLSMVPATATEATALEALFREHHERVFRTAWRVTGSAADAEDVLQTVFLRLARTSENVHYGDTPNSAKAGGQLADWSENPEAYLSRAAINASLDLIRKRKRSRSVAMDDVEHTAVMTDSASLPANNATRNPQAHHEDIELRKLIRAAVSRLGEKAGEMFALRYFEGYDNGEIARLMKTSALVVGVTLHRARARLRKEIGAYVQSDRGGQGGLSA